MGTAEEETAGGPGAELPVSAKFPYNLPRTRWQGRQIKFKFMNHLQSRMHGNKLYYLPVSREQRKSDFPREKLSNPGNSFAGPPETPIARHKTRMSRSDELSLSNSCHSSSLPLAPTRLFFPIPPDPSSRVDLDPSGISADRIRRSLPAICLCLTYHYMYVTARYKSLALTVSCHFKLPVSFSKCLWVGLSGVFKRLRLCAQKEDPSR